MSSRKPYPVAKSCWRTTHSLESSLLVIERRRHERLEGTLSTGVPDEAPQRFRLVLDGEKCEIVHLNSGKRHALNRTRCRAEEAP